MLVDIVNAKFESMLRSTFELAMPLRMYFRIMRSTSDDESHFSQLLRAARSPLVRDELVADLASELEESNFTVMHNGEFIFKRCIIVNELRDAAGGDADTRPLSHVAVRSLFKNWMIHFEEMLDGEPVIDGYYVYIVLACLYHKTMAVSEEHWKKCWDWLRYYRDYYQKQPTDGCIAFRTGLSRLSDTADKYDASAWGEVVAFWNDAFAGYNEKQQANKKAKL